MDDETFDVGPLHDLVVRRSYEPQLLVALPEGFTSDDLSLDGLVAEWTACLDPVEAVRYAAQEHFADQWGSGDLGGDWVVVAGTVEAPPDTIQSLRVAAGDDGVIAAWNAARGDLIAAQGGLDGAQIKTLTTWNAKGESDFVANAGLPVLVGLAILAMAKHPVGPCGRHALAVIEANRKRPSR